jgi:hypothetical protein
MIVTKREMKIDTRQRTGAVELLGTAPTDAVAFDIPKDEVFVIAVKSVTIKKEFENYTLLPIAPILYVGEEFVEQTQMLELLRLWNQATEEIVIIHVDVADSVLHLPVVGSPHEGIIEEITFTVTAVPYSLFPELVIAPAQVK